MVKVFGPLDNPKDLPSMGFNCFQLMLYFFSASLKSQSSCWEFEFPEANAFIKRGLEHALYAPLYLSQPQSVSDNHSAA